MPTCFVVDKMLGKLSKWLRILGFDTVYLDNPSLPEIKAQIERGRIFLTRNRKILDQVESGVFIFSDKVEDQLQELSNGGLISCGESEWFSRCILCNEPLKSVSKEDVDGRVPEFVRMTAHSFSICPVCGKIYWPGSHLSRMREKVGRLRGCPRTGIVVREVDATLRGDPLRVEDDSVNPTDS